LTQYTNSEQLLNTRIVRQINDTVKHCKTISNRHGKYPVDFPDFQECQSTKSMTDDDDDDSDDTW